MVKLVGILNITPDSFSDGGQFVSVEAALEQARALKNQGATWLDVGAESTRPGARAISPAEEWARMESFWQAVLNTDDLNITEFSLDTRHHQTADKFLRLGGKIINDVSGFQDPAIRLTVAQYQAICIVNHFPGETVADVHEQNISSISRVKSDLLASAHQLIDAGVSSDKIILDPGIGFGKTFALNWELLEFAALVPDWPVLIGHSKKRFLGTDRSEKAVNVKAGAVALKSGAQYLRVHNPDWY